MNDIKVNLDDVISYLRELLYLSRPELLKLINYEVSTRYRDKIKKIDMIVDILEHKFNPKVLPRKRFVSDYKDIQIG